MKHKLVKILGIFALALLFKFVVVLLKNRFDKFGNMPELDQMMNAMKEEFGEQMHR